ncbi:MAG TPA: branched-chain amino acid ABC transporter permease [Gaiellales bacterium]
MTTVEAPLQVERFTPVSRIFTAAVGVLAVALFFVPVLLGANATQKMTSLLILVMLAMMWNALAGYGGLVSVGQQAFVGLGAYGTIYLVDNGVTPYLAMLLSALASGVIALPVSVLMLRLRAAQFAIGMWVVAESFALLVTLDGSLGGGTGTSLIELNRFSPSDRQEYTYWLTLGFTTFLLALLFVLLRSRLGASLQAIRDDEDAAASVGVRVMAGKRILFVIAAAGCGAAGAMTLANTLFIEPTSIFSVQWTAYMIFMVLVGGLGTFEGPIIGAVLLFLIQNEFSDSGVWYLVGLGAIAMAFALFLPKGIWGACEERFGIRLMPVGYRLRRRRGGDG